MNCSTICSRAASIAVKFGLSLAEVLDEADEPSAALNGAVDSASEFGTKL